MSEEEEGGIDLDVNRRLLSSSSSKDQVVALPGKRER